MSYALGIWKETSTLPRDTSKNESKLLINKRRQDEAGFVNIATNPNLFTKNFVFLVVVVSYLFEQRQIINLTYFYF